MEEPAEEQWFGYDPASPYSGAEDRRITATEAYNWKETAGSRILLINNWTTFAEYEEWGCPDNLTFVPFSQLGWI